MRALARATAAIVLLASPSASLAQTAEPEHAMTESRLKLKPLSLTQDQQKTLIERLLVLHNQMPTPPNFKPTLGGEVPKAVHISAFPSRITSELPALKEFWYAHLDRAIVLVDAMALKVAAVVPLPEPLWADERKSNPQQAALNWAAGLADLSKEQKQELYRTLSSATDASRSSAHGAVQPVPDGITIRARTDLPADMRTAPLPQPVASRFEQFSGFGFAELQDGRLVIADPQRHVVGLITRSDGQGASPDAQPRSRDPLRNLEETPNASAYTGPGSKR